MRIENACTKFALLVLMICGILLFSSTKVAAQSCAINCAANVLKPCDDGAKQDKDSCLSQADYGYDNCVALGQEELAMCRFWCMFDPEGYRACIDACNWSSWPNDSYCSTARDFEKEGCYQDYDHRLDECDDLFTDCLLACPPE